MGLLKKITRPISRVLDKIVPNEIKPALPFLAAAAPFMAPGIMGIGGNTMLSRALMSGGLNLGAQLAQEGSEGEFSPLSVALASGIGALSAPGAGDTLRGVNRLDEFGTAGDVYKGTQAAQAPSGFLGQGKEFLAKGADKLEGIIAAGRADPFSMAGLKAASIPITQGAMDLGIAETRRFNKQQAIDDALAQAELLEDSGARAAAIRQFMEAAGYFSEDEIAETITAAGYADGGRVGFDNGGDVEKELDTVLVMIEGPDGVEVKEVLKSEALRENLKIVSDTGEFNQYRFDNVENKKAGGRVGLMMGGDPDFAGIKGAVEGVDKNMRADRAGDFFRLRDEAIQKGDDDKIKEIESDFFKEFGMVMPKMMAGGELEKNIFLQGGPTIERLLMNKEEKKQDKDKIKKELEELGVFKRKKVAEGGLMNLGGKEMDLRKGGFVPIGKKEKADDVPARLSKNEFVMTADAVRGAGGGNINKGAKRMYETMNRLEARA